MLSLQSPRWAELQHAYGAATDIPGLLQMLTALPDSVGDSQPWLGLWSSLAHQGDVYSASFAAVPHVIHVLAEWPAEAPAVFFQFPAWVEICRKRSGIAIPPDLEPAYTEALSRIPALAAAAASRPWSAEMLQSVLSAIAAVKGDVAVAEAGLELSPEIAASFLMWLEEQ
jgi:hypothetical protein